MLDEETSSIVIGTDESQISINVKQKSNVSVCHRRNEQKTRIDRIWIGYFEYIGISIGSLGYQRIRNWNPTNESIEFSVSRISTWENSRKKAKKITILLGLFENSW